MFNDIVGFGFNSEFDTQLFRSIPGYETFELPVPSPGYTKLLEIFTTPIAFTAKGLFPMWFHNITFCIAQSPYAIEDDFHW